MGHKIIKERKCAKLVKQRYENANFLKLSGENMDGSVSQLVFYTPRGVQRVKDLTGKGFDHDPCGGHSH